MKRFITKLKSKVEGIPLNIIVANFIFQKILRIDSECDFLKNYTSRVLCPDKIVIENNAQSVLKSFAVSGGCYIQACGGIYIGDGTIWSFNVAIVSQDHDVDDLSQATKVEPIRIGRNCWIGVNATVLPGVELGDKTIVGANSVVTKSFPQGNVVIAGAPAKIIRELK